MVYALVFTILMTHQAFGEDDCYREKDEVKHDCKKTLLYIMIGRSQAPNVVKPCKNLTWPAFVVTLASKKSLK
jgi:hypothetical protein